MGVSVIRFITSAAVCERDCCVGGGERRWRDDKWRCGGRGLVLAWLNVVCLGVVLLWSSFHFLIRSSDNGGKEEQPSNDAIMAVSVMMLIVFD